jgi:hypothetical protein
VGPTKKRSVSWTSFFFEQAMLAVSKAHFLLSNGCLVGIETVDL